MHAVLPRPEDFQPVSFGLHKTIGIDPVMLYLIDTGGTKVYRWMRPSLRELGVNYDKILLEQASDYYNERYRPITGVIIKPHRRDSPVVPLREAGYVHSRTKGTHLVLADDDITVGNSIVGGVVEALSNYDVLQFKDLYVAVYKDDRGEAAHFAVRRYHDTPANLDTLMRTLAPAEYKMLRKKGLLDLIAVMPPPDLNTLGQEEGDANDDFVDALTSGV